MSSGTETRRHSRPGAILTVASLALACLMLIHAVRLSVWGTRHALSFANWSRADFFTTSAWPALILGALFFAAFVSGQRRRYRRCGLQIAWGGLLVCLLLLSPRGVYAVGWNLTPVLVLLVACLFGTGPGVQMGACTMGAILFSAAHTEPHPDLAGVWAQGLILCSVILAMATLGAMLQRTLNLAIRAEEDQLQRIDEARRALRHRENLLRHAMRVETVGEMSSMVVHQLRNQFQMIMGLAATGMRSEDPRTQESSKAIVATVGQSNELLEDLLGMARRDASRVSRVDLADFCLGACENYRRVLPAKIELSIEAPDQPVLVHLDAQSLDHALLNLIINARQAMDAGGGHIHVRVRPDGDRAILEVSDNGPGIPAEVVEHVFKPFFTTKEKGQGTGLGLAAVQRFVIASHGEVRVESQPGRGATFVLSFPVDSAAVTEAG